ncbi:MULTISPECIES: zinc-binding metallopeptidase family protein [Acetobacter]|uniref:zinc-binding metallopeptidase family protein n=1 Tax=Acetobacter TaxID=434 RepID=UPI001C051462|nr:MULTISPECIES: putative zinc-binding metallopeptidase [Acetobacter]MCP1271480.1 putative zinc-binding peptidase [Acetobacter cerevisiae]MCP1279434.1 putative zinc-binding peptidase [Acetobacter cerevisiae]
MRLFTCQSCEQILFFENTVCEHCKHQLGYLPGLSVLSALEPVEGGLWRPLEPRIRQAELAYCANHAHDVCNWMTMPNEAGHPSFCFACRFNRIIPNLDKPENLERWHKLEVAKHRLFYTLLRLKLPMKTRLEDPLGGLVFDFLDDPPDGSSAVMTGHNNGVITIALREADDACRERMRVEMGEYYRTLLGHFRHEVGHYYWNVLVRDAGRLDACRAVFGDDRADYQQALQTYYDSPRPTDWQTHHVSIYATSHPWEDFAETWAHYLHIVSTLETAWAYGVSINPALAGAQPSSSPQHGDPYTEASFDEIMQAWLPLTYAVNSLNRSMGLPDFYPFVLTQGVVNKLSFIHTLIRETQALRSC